MGPLRLKMLNAMKLRRFSPKTRKAYIGAVAGLAKHYNKSPEKISHAEIQKYLLYLQEERQLAWSSCNIVKQGLKFLYTHTLQRKDFKVVIPPALERLFSKARCPRDKVMFMTAYSAGLRVGELVQLKVSHIDSARMMVRVEMGKGNKDRYTLLSKRLLEELRRYWKLYRPELWLFPGVRNFHEPMIIGTIQKILFKAKKDAGLKKGFGIHTLRHCFATHLLEAGVDLRTIQILMGHNSISTTTIYLQVTRKRIDSIKSAFDYLIPLP